MASKPEQIVVGTKVTLPYRYSAGRYGSRFLKALQKGKILASRCDKATGGCGLVLVPPRVVCARCYRRMEDWVELPPTGSLTSFTQVTFPFIDPFTGKTRPIPYCYGMIRFDGADNTFQFFLEESDIRKIHIGLRLKAVFRRKREGSIRDILFFRTLKTRPSGQKQRQRKRKK